MSRCRLCDAQSDRQLCPRCFDGLKGIYKCIGCGGLPYIGSTQILSHPICRHCVEQYEISYVRLMVKNNWKFNVVDFIDYIREQNGCRGLYGRIRDELVELEDKVMYHRNVAEMQFNANAELVSKNEKLELELARANAEISRMRAAAALVISPPLPSFDDYVPSKRARADTMALLNSFQEFEGEEEEIEVV